ncbi:uncharacterized protein [Dysidea avara]|uniref:uncharacterized protein isoform X1 n=1 Tax=Dysidea avara TaxID=196820 RepID=UPI00332AB6B6
MASNLVCSEPKKQCISRTTRYRLRKESKCISSDFDDSTHRELEATEYDDSTLQDYYDHQTGHNLDGSFHNPIDHHQSCIVLDEAGDNHLANHSYCIDCREPDYHMYYSDDTESDNDDINDTDTNADVHISEPTVTNLELFEGSSLNTLTSNVLILKYSMKHKLTNDALADLLKLLKLHLPTPNHCAESVYCLRKSLDQFVTGYVHTTHYFCSSCTTEVEVNCALCPNSDCEAALVSNDSRSSFIEIPIEQQLKKIIKRNYSLIEDTFHKALDHISMDKYTDITSGDLYKNLVSSNTAKGIKNYITLSLNTDGIPVFHSSGYSFWPLYLSINELPFKLRFVQENRVFAGLWYGSVKPDMTIFLKPVAKELQKLQQEGIVINQSQLVWKAFLLCFVSDLPAKALVLNFIQL